FDVYRGESIPAGTKSLAFALVYQAPDRTLGEKEIEKAHQKIEGRLRHVLKAQIRGKDAVSATPANNPVDTPTPEGKWQKVSEAEYFLGRMTETIEDRKAYEHNLSAFLASSRSVLQYALKEAEYAAGGAQWYNSWMTTKPVIAYFRDKRNVSIHVRPV